MTTHRWWPESLYALVGCNAAGRLRVTEALLRSWMSRPELALVDDSCVAERRLVASLDAAPARIVEHGEIAAIEDEDARDNWFAYLAFRDRVLAQPDIESAWLELFLDGLSGIAPLFVPQLTEIILHALLEDCDDPLMWRAAELFFRSQRATPQSGRVLMADARCSATTPKRAASAISAASSCRRVLLRGLRISTCSIRPMLPICTRGWGVAPCCR